MGLERKNCKNCKTVYYGNDKEGMDDGYCFMCSTTMKFLKMFDLDDIPINEIDPNRVRFPKFENTNQHNCRDWRNYIPLGLMGYWDKLPVESRMLAIMFAEREARAVDIISDVIVKEGKKC